MTLPVHVLVELASAARVLAHLTHFGKEPEERVLAALGIEQTDWDVLRDDAIARAADDTDAGIAFATAFAKTKRELAERKPSLEEIDQRASASPAAKTSAPEEPPAVPAPPPAEVLTRTALEVPSFAKSPPPPRSFTDEAAHASRGAALVEKPQETIEIDPEVVRRATLPFRTGAPNLPPPAVAPGASGSDGETLPAAASGMARGDPHGVSRRVHAELTADMERMPYARATLLRERGLTDRQFVEADAEWRRRLASDRVQLAQWQVVHSTRRRGR